MIEQIKNLPDVSFIDDMTLDDVQGQMVSDYQEKYEEITGEALTLRRTDLEMLKLYACSVQIYQMMLHIDRAGKMDLLKYAYGEFLDNLGALRGISRLPASPAKCVVRFTLSEPQNSATVIPKGTRVSDGNALYFSTDDAAEIKAGEMSADIPCTCQTAGEIGNGLMPGTLNTLVDLMPYIGSVENTDATGAGSDVEDDESFTDRIYLAPSGYSTAGPMNAYIYHTKSADQSIGDVHVSSPEPGLVRVYFLKDDGALPDEELIKKVKEHLDDRTIRPLTDKVEVLKPEEETFDIDATYYISGTDKDSAQTIQNAVDEAIAAYVKWQTCAIGRDINPSALIQMTVNAGAKRVEVTSPVFKKISLSEEGADRVKVARLGQKRIAFGGIEDD